jgi:hypothetical protein
VKHSAQTKGRLRRIAKMYARKSGKDWVDEVNELYRNEAGRKANRKVKR